MTDNKVWVITRKELDNSGYEVMDLCYEKYDTAYHVWERLKVSDTSREYKLIELGVIQGELK
jgi:hypothetical protein